MPNEFEIKKSAIHEILTRYGYASGRTPSELVTYLRERVKTIELPQTLTFEEIQRLVNLLWVDRGPIRGDGDTYQAFKTELYFPAIKIVALFQKEERSLNEELFAKIKNLFVQADLYPELKRLSAAEILEAVPAFEILEQCQLPQIKMHQIELGRAMLKSSPLKFANTLKNIEASTFPLTENILALMIETANSSGVYEFFKPYTSDENATLVELIDKLAEDARNARCINKLEFLEALNIYPQAVNNQFYRGIFRNSPIPLRLAKAVMASKEAGILDEEYVRKLATCSNPEEVGIYCIIMKVHLKENDCINQVLTSDNPISLLPVEFFKEIVKCDEIYSLCFKLGINKNRIDQIMTQLVAKSQIKIMDGIAQLEVQLSLPKDKRQILVDCINGAHNPLSFVNDLQLLLKAGILQRKIFDQIKVSQELEEFINLILQEKKFWPDFNDPKNASLLSSSQDCINMIIALLILNKRSALEDDTRVAIAKHKDHASAAVTLVLLSRQHGVKRAAEFTLTLDNPRIEARKLGAIEDKITGSSKETSPLRQVGQFKESASHQEDEPSPKPGVRL